MVCDLRRLAVTVMVPCSAMLLLSCGSGDDGSSGSPFAFASPGGFVEKAGSAIRPRWSTAEVRDVVPNGRGKFTFPAPYLTEAIRVTNAEDCDGEDCVSPVGYSYWRNINNHVGSNEMLIFLGLNRSRGGTGPTLFSYDKTSEQVTNRGPLFKAGHRLSSASTAGWYFSATRPTTIYINNDSKMLRYDVVSHASEVVFDLADKFGSHREVYQMSSSYYDDVHAATLRVEGTDTLLGCVVYMESTGQFSFYPKAGVFDECQIDRSGRFLMIWEQIDGRNGVDNRIIDLATGAEERHLDAPGMASLGHHDMGFGYAVGHDHYNPLPNATLTWTLSPAPVRGPADHRDYNWDLVQAQHISHTNARPDLPKEQQFACGSNADRMRYAQNEI
ncbi:MAG TPA: hypothetical protein VFM24_00540, partial [Nitrospira sp.]|nr:hypothetical protein [Nitrospira sp.]